MAQCLTFSYTTCGSTCGTANVITYQVYEDTSTTLANCTGTGDQIFMSAVEYQTLVTNQAISANLYNPDFLTQPELQTAFGLGFTIPLIVYLVAWGYQSVIEFATKD